MLGVGMAESVKTSGDEGSAAAIEFFENRIRPVLVERCYACHGPEAAVPKGGLRVDSRAALLKGGERGPAVVLGRPEESRLITAIRHEQSELKMPRGEGGASKLSELAIRDLTEWVRGGVVFPARSQGVGGSKPPDVNRGSGERLQKPHWAFQPVRRPVVPSVRRSDWPLRPLDYFVLARLEREGMKPAASAGRRAWLRRATYDLTGLPPTAEEFETFEADGASDAYDRVVDRLLESPRYGERWGRHWLDVARYADTAGETADYPVPVAWRYRNYVIQAFNEDKPYDEFLREQIAGDILARSGPRERYAERVAATGYLAQSRRFGFDSENYHHLTIQDSIDTLGQSVMGLSLGCARCHDHKYDPVSAADYYALYGIFESSRYAFPGSEQKTKFRALAPLMPPEESRPKWRDYERRVGQLASTIEQQKQSVPGVVLRSLDEMDGDFEMQAVANGGSKGVLVPPWVCSGMISVTREAQSPFKNLHPRGQVGASIGGGTNHYEIAQSLTPSVRFGQGKRLYANLDFRVATNDLSAVGAHRFWVGQQGKAAPFEVVITSSTISVRAGGTVTPIRSLRQGQWHNLRLEVDLGQRMLSGVVGVPGDETKFEAKGRLPGLVALMNYVSVDSGAEESSSPRPGLEIDNLGVREVEIPPVTTTAVVDLAGADRPDLGRLEQSLRELVGTDSDFELQTVNTAPSTPWNRGPNGAALISNLAQSPFTNAFGLGRLGVRMGSGGAYDGFGLTLTNRWRSETTERLVAGFEFRCGQRDGGGDGTWRYYVGHGPGSSAAVEFFFNERGLYRRSGTEVETVGSLRMGAWYQVRIGLNLKARTYEAWVVSDGERLAFRGPLAAGWDGSIDYTFVDSYGHRGGVRPAVDVDNMAVGEPGSVEDGMAWSRVTSVGGEQRVERVRELRSKIGVAQAGLEGAKKELQTLLAEGPFELAYAVVEGTPKNARMQIRGEPERLGVEVPRGFLPLLGGGAFPVGMEGSGRLELARAVTSPSNPLTARVMVNRIWQHHFGEGLVKTPNDFGVRGQRPTDPELLDFLASEFVRVGWSMKSMHRMIMLSATYRQGSDGESGGGVGRDAGAPRVGRATGGEHQGGHGLFGRRRLTAEEIRDSILMVSGELDWIPGMGHPFPNPTGWGYSQHAPFSAVYDHNKRGVYLMSQRIKRHPFLALFDGADPNTSTADRRGTTVPTQALYFLNDPFVHGKAERLAARVIVGQKEEEARVMAVHRRVLGRTPNEEEKAEAMSFLAAYRVEAQAAHVSDLELASVAAYARTLMGSNEFLHVD